MRQGTTLLIAIIWAANFTIAPAHWATCAHHFDIFSNETHATAGAQSEYFEQIANEQICGQTADTHSGQDSETHCICGDLSCVLGEGSGDVSPAISNAFYEMPDPELGIVQSPRIDFIIYQDPVLGLLPLKTGPPAV